MLRFTRTFLSTVLLGRMSHGHRAEAEGKIVEVDEASSFSLLNPGDDCLHLVEGAKSCEVGKKLGGGKQANTNKAVIDGKAVVLKETSYDEMVTNLNAERKIVAQLQSPPAFTEMPQVFLQYTAKQPGSAVMVMEFLQGYSDLNQHDGAYIFDKESADTREVRLSAFFLALFNMHSKGVSHCDLNPGNAMFNIMNPADVKIIDFGMSERGSGGSCSSIAAIPDLGPSGGACEQICGNRQFHGLLKGNKNGGVCSMCHRATNLNGVRALAVQAKRTVNAYQLNHPSSGSQDIYQEDIPEDAFDSQEDIAWPSSHQHETTDDEPRNKKPRLTHDAEEAKAGFDPKAAGYKFPESAKDFKFNGEIAVKVDGKWVEAKLEGRATDTLGGKKVIIDYTPVNGGARASGMNHWYNKDTVMVKK